MDTLITVLHVIVCIFLVLVVLLQAGKGGGMGIAFGGAGGGGSVFGGSGAGNFLTKLTVISAFLFMITSMTLAYIASKSSADPLKALSAKSRAAAKEREEARQKILDPEVAPEGAEGAEGAVDTPDEGLIDTPDEGLIDTPAEGATDTPAEGATDTPAEGATDTPAEGATDTPAAEPEPAAADDTPTE